jgi:hypothetical protein
MKKRKKFFQVFLFFFILQGLQGEKSDVTLMDQAKLALVNPLCALSTQRPRNDPSGRMLQKVAVVSLALHPKSTDAVMSAGLAKTPPLRCSVIIPRRPALSMMCVAMVLFCVVLLDD